MNKHKAGDKVKYINLKSKEIISTIIRYEKVKTIVCGKTIISVCAKLKHGELVNDEYLKKL